MNKVINGVPVVRSSFMATLNVQDDRLIEESKKPTFITSFYWPRCQAIKKLGVVLFEYIILLLLGSIDQKVRKNCRDQATILVMDHYCYVCFHQMDGSWLTPRANHCMHLGLSYSTCKALKIFFVFFWGATWWLKL